MKILSWQYALYILAVFAIEYIILALYFNEL